MRNTLKKVHVHITFTIFSNICWWGFLSVSIFHWNGLPSVPDPVRQSINNRRVMKWVGVSFSPWFHEYLVDRLGFMTAVTSVNAVFNSSTLTQTFLAVSWERYWPISPHFLENLLPTWCFSCDKLWNDYCCKKFACTMPAVSSLYRSVISCGVYFLNVRALSE